MSIDSSQVAIAINRPTSPETAVRPQAAKVTSPAPAVNSGSASHGSPGMPQARQFEVSSSFGDAHLVVYRIIDKETGDLIQQIPPGQPEQVAQLILHSTQADESIKKTVDIES